MLKFTLRFSLYIRGAIDTKSISALIDTDKFFTLRRVNVIAG
jgi:hypothetical protein